MEGSVEVVYPSIGTLFNQEAAPSTSPTPATTFPILEFLFFHKAIRAELGRLYSDALAVEKGGEKEFQALSDRYEFVRVVYMQHSNAEDEVIFPALDSRVKNIAKTYSLEHKEEKDLFDQMLELLNVALKESANASAKLRRELICCTEALQTTLCKHMSKEEEQVLPLVIKHFSFQEQAGLVWQFICSIPVNLMEVFLPWLASCLSKDEHREMIACMHKVIPKERLLQQVVFTWLRGASVSSGTRDAHDAVDGSKGSINSSHVTMLAEDTLVPFHQEECLKALKDVPVLLPCKRKVEHPPLSSEDHDNRASTKRATLPIDVVLYWHAAIKKELADFTVALQNMQLTSPTNLLVLSERLQFLMDACTFHSAAEDKVLFPAISKKAKKCISFACKHADEEHDFDNIRHMIEGFQMKRELMDGDEFYGKLHERLELLCKNVHEHFLDEETEVLPLAREHLSCSEQRDLVYQSFRVMPLKLLEKMLPWLVAALNEEEVKNLLDNIRLAAPPCDAALSILLLGWACKGRVSSRPMNGGSLGCIFGNGECLGKRLRLTTGEESCCKSGQSPSKQEEDACATTGEQSKRPRLNDVGLQREDPTVMNNNYSQVPTTRATSCCVPALGVGISSRSYGMCAPIKKPSPSKSSQGGSYLGSGLFGLGSDLGSPVDGSAPKPIDTIFQFHKAIRKDLEYLDDESAQLADCDVEFVRQFCGRFQLLWGLYRAHSNAEDAIVFPALEAKESLHNVSHSYTIDHKHEERLFKEISDVLSELSHLYGLSHRQEDPRAPSKDRLTNQSSDIKLQKQGLASKLQGMCKSVRVTLDQHVSREEIELWPLFALHFTTEEQEKIVGQIIGTTGAEVLQAMLPWVTTALSQEEQSTMMYTWRQATRNTMFDKWLRAWWKGSPVASPDSQSSDDEVPASGTCASLQIVADYLSKGTLDRKESATHSSDMDTHGSPEGSAWDELSHDEAKSEKEVKGSSSSEMKASISSHAAIDKINNADCGQGFDAEIEESSGKFKPGWQDIFRMNEKELEAAVRKVSGDTSLDPRRKAYLMQNLLTSRWIVAQQHPPQAMVNDQEEIPGRCPSYTDDSQQAFGCEHYKRNCKVRAACCGVLFPCRFCHDKVSDHTMDRQATKEMMCMQCLEVQPVAQYCATPSCNGIQMAKYYCGICKLFDDARDIYHCPSCNLCRLGRGLGIDFFHCMTCNACMSTALTSHKCREKGLESNCPICHDYLFTSHTPVKALTCGHFMHSACYRAYTYSHYTCPICSKSLGVMDVSTMHALDEA